MAQKEVEADEVGDQAARGCDDRLGIGFDRLLERAALVAAVGVLAVEPENFADAAAGELLDLAGELDKRKVEILRQHAAQRRLSRAAQADERDPRRAQRARPRRAEPRRQRVSRPRGAPGAASPRPRLANISRKLSHSGDWVVTSPRISASEHCSARDTCKRTRIEALPTPYSRLARCRSETPVARAKALRVRPRRTRSALARSPSARRNGSLPGLGIRLDRPRRHFRLPQADFDARFRSPRPRRRSAVCCLT